MHGLIDVKNIFKLRARRSIPSWGEFAEEINNYYLQPENYKVSGESFADLQILAIDFYIVFTAATMKGLNK